LESRIEWRGAQPQEAVLQAYREADLFVLASRIAPDGDRDGLPNVLMEAQSQGLACLSTTISAVPELIETERNGILVPPDDPAALATQLARLIGDPGTRQRLGAAAAHRVRDCYAMDAGIDILAARFGADLAARAAQ
jgi:glycosyltransferase involved in cell wall biosynthesis